MTDKRQHAVCLTPTDGAYTLRVCEGATRAQVAGTAGVEGMVRPVALNASYPLDSVSAIDTASLRIDVETQEYRPVIVYPVGGPLLSPAQGQAGGLCPRRRRMIWSCLNEIFY
jgi:hypothetical protein